MPMMSSAASSTNKQQAERQVSSAWVDCRHPDQLCPFRCIKQARSIHSQFRGKLHSKDIKQDSSAERQTADADASGDSL